MLTTIKGFPRIGKNRELKWALESFWKGNSSEDDLETLALSLRKEHWQEQLDAGIDIIPAGEFSFYDTMLDTCILFGAVPERFASFKSGSSQYFAMARGSEGTPAMEMTKWFNTNYHYIVPELTADTKFTLSPERLVDQYREAIELAGSSRVKLTIPGALTFLKLARMVDGSNCFDLLPSLLTAYEALIGRLSADNDDVIVEFDESSFCYDVSSEECSLLADSYRRLCRSFPKARFIISFSYGHASEAIEALREVPLWGVAVDLFEGADSIQALKNVGDKIIFAGLVNGRNVWRADLDLASSKLAEIAEFHPRESIAVTTSCSLLHVPYSIAGEENPDLAGRISFACEKLREVVALRDISDNAESTSLPQPVAHRELNWERRHGSFEERKAVQEERFQLPPLPTTTIGSFPQTVELRRLRQTYRKGSLSHEHYEHALRQEIKNCIDFQEEIGLDVFVHGEAERTDMVEYFGEMLDGFAFTKNGWVQSYGSRCVKPPLIFGDVSRPEPMTVRWITYAQSLTDKPVKGMLTGPVTILNWSFPREDISKAEIAYQIAEAISAEIDDLQRAGIGIVQVDEAAFREGYPLRESAYSAYESWAVGSFHHAVRTAKLETQIHTHMCYSDFGKILNTISDLDADVITIETSRSGNRLFSNFREKSYVKGIGPGMYDIHSPVVPTSTEMEERLSACAELFPLNHLWVNPDCGLKTRQWPEVEDALRNMVGATISVREKLQVS